MEAKHIGTVRYYQVDPAFVLNLAVPKDEQRGQIGAIRLDEDSGMVEFEVVEHHE